MDNIVKNDGEELIDDIKVLANVWNELSSAMKRIIIPAIVEAKGELMFYEILEHNLNKDK